MQDMKKSFYTCGESIVIHQRAFPRYKDEILGLILSIP